MSSGRSRNDPRKVFVGNVPYEIHERVVREILSEVGEIVSFGLTPDTTNPSRLHKGYGFCTYTTVESANRAKRELNLRQVGGRPIKVDDPAEPGAGVSALPEKVSAGPLFASGANVSRAVEQLSLFEKWTIIKEFKNLVDNDPQKAKSLLKDIPPLSQALLHCQTALGMLQSPPQKSREASETPGGAAAGTSSYGQPHPGGAGVMPPPRPAAGGGGLLGSAPGPAVRPGVPRGPPSHMPGYNFNNPAAVHQQQGFMSQGNWNPPAGYHQQSGGAHGGNRRIMEIMNMSPQEIRRLPPEQQEDVRKTQTALTWSVEQIRELEPQQRDELLQLKSGLQQQQYSQ